MTYGRSLQCELFVTVSEFLQEFTVLLCLSLGNATPPVISLIDWNREQVKRVLTPPLGRTSSGGQWSGLE